MKMRRVIILRLIIVLMISIIIGSLPIPTLAKESSNIIKYSIRLGDTYYLLSARFGTTIENISLMNKGVNPQNLLVGQKINIPVGKNILIHKVYKGDVLWKIAQKYDNSIETIASQNYIRDPNLIYVGDILAIPKNKKVVWLTGMTGEFGGARNLSQEDYDGAYNFYTTKSEEELDRIIKDIQIKLAQARVDENGKIIRDEEGNIVYYGSSNLWVDGKGQWNVRLGVSGFTVRMGVGWGIQRTFTGTLNTTKIGFTNGVPVDVEKFAKALFVYASNML